jgi:drug/metabolite transporter (DMT)-like permease
MTGRAIFVQNKDSAGHLSALVTIIIWGTTFTSTKILLQTFTPVEVQVMRNVIAFLALYLAKPQRLIVAEKWHELLFAGAGLTGLTLYHVFENTSLSATNVANTSLIVATSPFFIALLSFKFLKAEKPGPLFFAGFLTAITGIALISINGAMNLRLNPFGDLLAFGASVVWAFYSVITKKLSSYGYDNIQITRRIFGYGLIFSLPLMFFADFRLSLELPRLLLTPVNLGNMLFLGVCASALCFGAWNFAVKMLGAVKTSVYIYMIPVISVSTSAIVLGEPVTWMLAAGAVLTLLGLILSEYKSLREGRLSVE